MNSSVATVSTLVSDLRRLGVADGDVVMVHASLRKIGPVADGAAAVIAALDAAVGTQGALLMTLGASDEWSWVNGHPIAERAELLADAEPFDPLLTPADPDVGVLAEVFRTTPGTVVTDNPEGRFGARGARAAALLDDAPWDDYYGPRSPLERLVQAGGKVLRLGADPDTVTLLHYAEYLTDVPDKRRALRHRRVLGPNGPVLRTVSCLDDSDGIVEPPPHLAGEDYFALITRAALAAGMARVGPVGNATSELLDAAALVNFGAEWMARNLT